MLLTTSPGLLPVDEATRLLTLHYYDILYSLQESVFNEFVILAARVFNLPMSLLGLVGASDVEYKANCGLPKLRQQARPEAICSQVVAQGKVIVLGDLTQMQATQLPTQASLAALAKGLRFYAGAPLRMPNQAVIGTLCVLGCQPRLISGQERQLLELLTHLVERVIVVRHACLVSRWLGQEYWQLTQAYIASTLCQISVLLNGSPLWPAGAPLEARVLQPVFKQLNELAWILAEPLPGYA